MHEKHRTTAINNTEQLHQLPGICPYYLVVYTRMNSLGRFLVHKLTCGKRESVS